MDNCSQVDALLGQAREWEESGNFSRAVETYLRISDSHTNDVDILEKSWSKAAELALKFLGDSKAIEIARLVGPRLIEIQKYSMVSVPLYFL